MRTAAVVGLKELREHVDDYIAKIRKGKSFLVVRRSTPVFRISSPDDSNELWEPVIDFTRIRRGGVFIGDVLSRL